MTLSALLIDEKKIVTPAVDVASGEMTQEQASREYRGIPCGCPHCLNHALESGIIGFSSGQLLDTQSIDPNEFREYTIFIQKYGIESAVLEATTNPDSVFAKLMKRFGSRQVDTSLQALLSGPYPIDSLNKDQRFLVSYNAASTRSDGSIRRFMHFSHLKGANAFKHCYDPPEVDHWVACAVLERDLKRKMYRLPEYSVKREFTFKIPSGREYRADVAVLHNDKLIEVYELQRTYRGLNPLKQKTQDVSEICSIKWVFFAGAYRQMGDQRDWLSSVGMHYYKLSFENYRLILEDGSPPARRSQDRHLHHIPKEPQGDGCINRERFGPDPEDSLGASQILGIDFRGAAKPDLSKDNNLISGNNEHFLKSGKSKSADVALSSNSERGGQEVPNPNNGLPPEQDDNKANSKFFVGRKIFIDNEIWMITAINFIFDKALLRLGQNTRWYSFDELDSFNE